MTAGPFDPARQARTAAAFCPGHVTGFFQVWDDHEAPLRRGSMGAGLSIGMGVSATARLLDGPGEHRILLNGEAREARVVRTTLSDLLPPGSPQLEVRCDTELPSGQGFGVSGAGALSAGLAAAKLLGLDAREAHRAAHKAEVTHHTGLGDVPAQWVGGFEMRLNPGVQPFGIVEPFAVPDIARYAVLLCVTGAALSTSEVLADPAARLRINDEGGRCLEALMKDPTVETLMERSAAFSDRLDLRSDRLQEALAVARRFGPASQSMLGDSLFLLLPADDEVRRQEAKAALLEFGWTALTTVADRGASGMSLRPARGPQYGPPGSQQKV